MTDAQRIAKFMHEFCITAVSSCIGTREEMMFLQYTPGTTEARELGAIFYDHETRAVLPATEENLAQQAELAGFRDIVVEPLEAMLNDGYDGLGSRRFSPILDAITRVDRESMALFNRRMYGGLFNWVEE